MQNDLKAVASIFRQLWFLLDCSIKFMTQFLIKNELFKVVCIKFFGLFTDKDICNFINILGASSRSFFY